MVSSSRVAATIQHSSRASHSPAAAMANAHDERLLSSHAAVRQYGSTDHQPLARVSFGAEESPSVVDSDERSTISSSSSSSVDNAGLADVTYRYMLYLYLLIPVIIGLFSYCLVLLGKYAWPPTAKERSLPHPPLYPHPFLWQPFSIGMLASICVQAMRYPVYEGLEIALNALSSGWTRRTDDALYDNGNGKRKRNISGLMASLLAITLHTSFHEGLRIFTLYLINPNFYSQDQLYSTTTQIFQQSYHLGLGWGLAEAFWGIAKGWFAGMRLYVDVLPWSRETHGSGQGANTITSIESTSDGFRDTVSSLEGTGLGPREESVGDRSIRSDDAMDNERGGDERADEEDLATKIAVLERLRGRRELEQVLGIPFPNIAFPLHILWRLDALLFNLGLTLIVSAYYYNIEPIYTRHPHQHAGQSVASAASRHRLLPLIIVSVIAIHLGVSTVWSLGVRKAGIGAVTWGSLIVSLGALFAGLGAWGALV